jgi:hypothetical protein
MKDAGGNGAAVPATRCITIALDSRGPAQPIQVHLFCLLRVVQGHLRVDKGGSAIEKK